MFWNITVTSETIEKRVIDAYTVRFLSFNSIYLHTRIFIFFFQYFLARFYILKKIFPKDRSENVWYFASPFLCKFGALIRRSVRLSAGLYNVVNVSD